MTLAVKQKALLDILQQRFFTPSGWQPVIGAEIEFYLPPEHVPTLEAFANKHADWIIHCQPEQGEGQYEIATRPGLAADAVEMLNFIHTQFGSIADFSAKPSEQQPASGLHINVHLEDAVRKNPYFKDDDECAPELTHSIAGMLATMRESMIAFAPHENSYARFTPRGQTPTTISWGANNRTVAVRLPDTGTHYKRIEHRVAGADANPALVVACVLAGIGYGLEEKLQLTLPQIYGDATLDQYGLEKLPASLEEAKAAIAEAKILPRVCPQLATLLQASAQNG